MMSVSSAADAYSKADRKLPCGIARSRINHKEDVTAYTSTMTNVAALEMSRTAALPTLSATAPPSGAEKADAYVRNPRKRPACDLLPPSANIRNGIVGKSKNAEANVV